MIRRGKGRARRLFTVTGGGTRSEQKPAYHLVPGHGARRIAQRFGLGAEIHGAENWKKSCDTEENARLWCEQAYDHMLDHAHKMASHEDPEDDHVGAIGWAVEIFAYCEQKFGKKWTEFAR